MPVVTASKSVNFGLDESLDSGLRKRGRKDLLKAGNEGLDTELLAPRQQANVSQNSIDESQDPLLSKENKNRVEVATQSRWAWRAEPGSLAYRFTVATFTILSILTRFYKISNGNFVLWDEAHFGKFGTHYIDGTFYFDVHPPLGKMLIGLAGRICGYRGGYGFQSGEKYPDNIPYVPIRMIVATFGSLCVPFNYIISKNLGFSEATSLLVGALTLLEIGLVSITRLILLDSMLLFFGLAVITFYTSFRKYNQQPFSPRWHLTLLLTGVSIGCVSSVKWVGFFITALVGLMTVGELWGMFGNWKIPMKTIGKHFAWRTLYLIVVPIGIYLLCFLLHFKFLFRSGPGNANMSSLFQAGLEGTDLGKSPLQVAFGSKITLRNARYGGGLLHSHSHNFPQGSKQQQITLYGHSDENNDWIVHRVYNVTDNSPATPFYTDESYQVQFLQHGDRVRLYHNSTGKYLHSHMVSAPISATDLEVTAYGGIPFDDPNDLWEVEIGKETYSGPGREEKIVRSLFSKLRFRHVASGCYLRSSGRSLPSWGFQQGEVSCKQNLKPGDGVLNGKEYLWNIEQHVNTLLPEGNSRTYRSRFLDDFIEHNIGMWRTNNALVPDSELEPSALTSKPHHWMLLLRGLRMSGFGDDQVKFYMLGNPFIWWTSAASIMTICSLAFGGWVLAQRRNEKPKTESESEESRDSKQAEESDGLKSHDLSVFWYQFQVVIGGWAFNYFPYFLMGRVTYLHHYYPSVLFAILAFGFLFEYIGGKLKLATKSRFIAAALITAVAALVFLHYAPIAYGFSGPSSEFGKTHRLLNSWNI